MKKQSAHPLNPSASIDINKSISNRSRQRARGRNIEKEEMTSSECDWQSGDEKEGIKGNRERVGSLSNGEGKERVMGRSEEEEGRKLGEKQIFRKNRKTGRSPINNATGEEGYISDILKG